MLQELNFSVSVYCSLRSELEGKFGAEGDVSEEQFKIIVQRRLSSAETMFPFLYAGFTSFHLAWFDERLFLKF